MQAWKQGTESTLTGFFPTLHICTDKTGIKAFDAAENWKHWSGVFCALWIDVKSTIHFQRHAQHGTGIIDIE